MPWRSVLLSDVVTVRSSLVDPTKFSYRNLPHVAPDSIERDSGRMLPVRTVAEDGVTSGKYRFVSGDLLYSKIRPNLNKVSLARFDGLCSADMYALHVDRAKALPNYIAYVLRGADFLTYATTLSNRANIPKLNRPQLMGYQFQLPPIEEQQRIADILDQSDALRTKRREALTLLEDLTQSIFLDMFGDAAPGDALGNHVEEFRYGTSNKFATIGHPTLRIPNVVHGLIDTFEIKTVPLRASEFQRLQLVDGDVLFVRSNGNPDAVGRCAIFRPNEVVASGFSPTEFAYASYLIRARLRPSLNAVFLRDYLSGQRGRAQLRSRCKTSAGQYNINIESLGSLAVPGVKIESQREYARRIDVVSQTAAVHRSGLMAHAEMFASLQQRAFSGLL